MTNSSNQQPIIGIFEEEEEEGYGRFAQAGRSSPFDRLGGYRGHFEKKRDDHQKVIAQQVAYSRAAVALEMQQEAVIANLRVEEEALSKVLVPSGIRKGLEGGLNRP